MAKEAGFKPAELSEYDKYTKEGFLGTLYAQTQDSKIKNNPDKVNYYKIPCDYSVYRYEKENPNKPLKTTLYADYAKGSNAYSVFLHGDFPRIDIKNKDSKNNKKLVVVKESYGNAFVPFLIPHYKEVIVIDSRHYKDSLEKLVKENNANEVLFINNAFAANTQKIVNTIKDLNK
ncbi:DHHW family protein [Paraclostridium bifermentans]|nr:DHHW family protein [Paraclostridium bifermentans]